MSSEQCVAQNDYDGHLGLRISSIFVILVGSFFGAWFPVFAARHKGTKVPEGAFFVAKYFGSGVIIATAFIHLLAPANDALSNPCLTGVITEYDWVEGICLMAVFVLFFVELIAMRFARSGEVRDDESERCDEETVVTIIHDHSRKVGARAQSTDHPTSPCMAGDEPHSPTGSRHPEHPAGPRPHGGGGGDDDHAGTTFDPESYAAQLTAIFILEFGVIFHSIFVGLTLAVSGREFVTLYVVLTFHQTFEGLALGSRLAAVAWPRARRRWTPYTMGLAYACSTPVAIAVGLGVRATFNPPGPTTLVVNGIFDSISAGILIYTGLVELMAHEFMFNAYMQRAPLRVVLGAVGCMVAGAAAMAVLGKWA